MEQQAHSSASGQQGVDQAFYLSADAFFRHNLPYGLTYDDITLATNYSEILPRETDLHTHVGKHVTLQIPVISSDMDTVTEAKMAIAMALNGGMGIIHYNMPERDQIKQVARVKNYVNGLIRDPITVRPEQTIGEAVEMMERRGFTFRTFPVVDEAGKLLGLLTGRVVKHRYADKVVSEAMTPRERVLTVFEDELGEDAISTADAIFQKNMGLHKLCVIDRQDRLRGLFTLSDIERIADEATSLDKPARDSKFRLRCAAAVSAPRTPEGTLDRERILSHVTNLVAEGLDAVAVSTAHGFSKGVAEVVSLIRSSFPDLCIIAGNVTTGEGVDFLVDAGADAIKVGQGPGSICTTRIVAGVGIPQLTAIYVAAKAARKRGVTIIADGGIAKSGDIVKALTIADSVILGSLLAGCREAPGEIMEIDGKLYKQYRGMGSLEAMKQGSAARYGHATADKQRKVAAEGIEALKEISGSVDETLSTLVGGIQSGMGYLGARNLCELKARARYIRVTAAGMRESAPHDVIEVKTAKT